MNIEKLGREVAIQLAKYVDVIKEDVDWAVHAVANDTCLELRETSPKDKGEYAADWNVKTPTKGKDRGYRVVYNASHYQLTHLLEFGHAKRSGGRVAPRPHIAQARDNAEKNLENAILAAVEGRKMR